MTYKILDLFCGAGGSAMGLYRVGFDVTGVDIKPQPHYPFKFIQADAMKIDLDGYDAYWASPPCQGYSEATPLTMKGRHPLLIEAVSKKFKLTGKPFIIENVEGARWHLENPIMLCGSMFGIGIWRHRWFETHPFYTLSPFECQHIGSPITVNPPANARKSQFGYRNFDAEKSAMQIDWMTKQELTQAIPPVYSEFLGKQLMKYLEANK